MTPYGGGEWARKQMQAAGYESGYQAGRAAATAECVQIRVKEANEHRVRAFAAIRRAASEARKADHKADILWRDEFHLQASYAESEAIGIRRAIRAAIGSDKA